MIAPNKPGTGGGFVFKRIDPAVSCPALDCLRDHTFADDLEAQGGAWLDAPETLPAGSVMDTPYGIFQRPAWRCP